jgi:hypothetical protein
MQPGGSCEWFLLKFADEFSIQYCGADSKGIFDSLTGNSLASA